MDAGVREASGKGLVGYWVWEVTVGVGSLSEDHATSEMSERHNQI